MKRVIVLENIRSLHNVGAIFRTADAAGWEKIHLTGYTGCPPDRRIEKVSLGAEEFIPWEQDLDPIECVKKLKSQEFFVIALELSTSAKDIFEYTPKSQEKIALILGNEVEGVSEELLSLSDLHLKIPMYGQKASLNVSVAAGIALYQLGKNS